MEVRCCCDAHLIGWIDGQFEEGKSYTFPLRHDDGRLTLEAARVQRLSATVEQVAPGIVAVGMVPETSVALKSRDYPIEQMRQIPGFREADADERKKHDASKWIVIRP